MLVNEVTGHGFSSHSRRPSECRVCKLPAARHTYAEVSEAHSVSIWRTMRNPLVTDRIQGYSDRTLNVLRHIADLGGVFDAWDRGNRGWHKTAVSILEKDGLFVRTNDGEAPGRYALTEAGRQACAWHGFEPTQDEPLDIPTDAEMSEIIAEHDAAMDAWAAPLLTATAPARITDTADRLLDASDIAEDIAQQWCEAGSPRDAQGRPLIEGSKPEADDIARSEDNGCAEASMCDDDECGACAHCRMLATVTEETVTDVFAQAMAESEREIWAGTGTMIEVTPKVRTFRKVKNTRSARRRRGGK